MNEYELWDQQVIQQLPHFEHVHKMVTPFIELLGYFPYEKMRVRGVKINAEMYEDFLGHVKEAAGRLDNKRTYIFKDHDGFGTETYFALFHHDGGVVVGDKIADY